MGTLLGIDIGTSSIKAMLLEVDSGMVYTEKSEYDIEIPNTDSAEQDPEKWWKGLIEILNRLRTGEQTREAFQKVEGIGFSGQMHGLVGIDKHGVPVRPAILWLDQRSGNMIKKINQKLTGPEIREVLHNRITAGFAFPSLLWIKTEENEIYKRIYKIFQPKDYIRFKMTGRIGTDMTDASATGIFDVGNRRWAWEIIDKFELNPDLFAPCHESYECAGYVTRECAGLTGLKEGIPVVYGCGDQMAQSIGNGVYQEGRLICNIGTGGQVSAYKKSFVSDKEMRINTFCHAVNQGYSVLGATLNGGNSLKWICNNLFMMKENGFETCNKMASQITAGSEGVICLPYLSGERTPIMDFNAKGVFFGLKLHHDKRHVIRSSMEGIIYSLKDCLLSLQRMGIDSDSIIASGGGASSPLFLQMQADIFEKEIQVCSVQEQACLGACILAGAGLKIFDFAQGCGSYVTFGKKKYYPIKENVKIYQEQFGVYHEIYENTKNLMRI